MKRKAIFISIFISVCAAAFLFRSPIAYGDAKKDAGSSLPKITNPVLSVSIPGFSGFRSAACTEESCSIPWLADYILVFFRYGITIIGILAVIVIMIAGVLWLTAAGNSEQVGHAKELIKGSLLGVLIAVSSYMILTIINPALTQLSPVKISYLEKIDLDRFDSPDLGNGESLPPGQPDGKCLATGDPSKLAEIVKKYEDKVYYRYGANGGNGIPFKKRPVKCPPGAICYDCSNFIRHALSCVGKTAPSGDTRAILENQEKIKSATSDTINGKKLNPGDLLGWPKLGGEGSGHVVMYIGNGQIAEVHGGSGWEGDAMDISSMLDYVNRYKDTKGMTVRRL